MSAQAPHLDPRWLRAVEDHAVQALAQVDGEEGGGHGEMPAALLPLGGRA